MIKYCTPEWLEESSKLYHVNNFEEKLQRISTKIFFRITAEPTWGIEEDITFGAFIEEGKLLKLDFFNFADAEAEADFILSASPIVWKGLLRKETKFVPEFLIGKVSLVQGSKPGLLTITPYAPHLVDSLTQFELQYPDEMTPDELEEYRGYIVEFRKKLDV
jgi:hypothetical protein